MNLQYLRDLGFDDARHIPFTKHYYIGCSQCVALSINGMPTHETRCPQATRKCKGCDAIIPAKQHYCEDCK